MRITVKHVGFVLISAMIFCPCVSFAAPHKVTVKKHLPGQWELLVDGQPYFVKGVVYNFTPVGDDPNLGTLRDWSTLDLNGNGRADTAYDAWVDYNRNNQQDEGEIPVGDWQLLKDLGANTIRIYQMPSEDDRLKNLYREKGSSLTFYHAPRKEIFRDLAERYGIKVIVGHFFGEWTIGSGATWDKGTDYADPLQRENLLMNIRVMVEEHKDEPYTLMWLIGNENFNPWDQDNAEKNPEAFLTLVNEAARLIHELDPYHPVALCNFHLEHLEEIARFAPEIDIFGANIYAQGFAEAYEKVKNTFDRPVLITEYGSPAYKEDDFHFQIQKNYHQVCWRDIVQNRYGASGVGNSIGALIFHWSDQWHLAGSADRHDNTESLGVKYAEWYGLVSLGNGRQSPFLRQLKRVYYLYKDFWTEN